MIAIRNSRSNSVWHLAEDDRIETLCGQSVFKHPTVIYNPIVEYHRMRLCVTCERRFDAAREKEARNA